MNNNQLAIILAKIFHLLSAMDEMVEKVESHITAKHKFV